jgi:hypothetical protein
VRRCGRGRAECDYRARERRGQAGGRNDNAGRNNGRMQPSRLPDGCELAATAVPTGSRFRRWRIGTQCVGADGDVRRRRQPPPTRKGDPLRRPGGNGDNDKEVGEACDATHDAPSIAPPPRATRPPSRIARRLARFDASLKTVATDRFARRAEASRGHHGRRGHASAYSASKSSSRLSRASDSIGAATLQFATTTRAFAPGVEMYTRPTFDPCGRLT